MERGSSLQSLFYFGNRHLVVLANLGIVVLTSYKYVGSGSPPLFSPNFHIDEWHVANISSKSFKKRHVNHKFILLFFFSLSSLKFHILLSLQYWEVHVCRFGRRTRIELVGTHREGWTWMHAYPWWFFFFFSLTWPDMTQYGLKYYKKKKKNVNYMIKRCVLWEELKNKKIKILHNLTISIPPNWISVSIWVVLE